MKKVLLIIVFGISLVSAKSLKENCMAKWKTDYSMVQYCVKKQSKAIGEILKMPEDEIYASCSRKWAPDYSMMAYCMKKQNNAKSSLGLNSSSYSSAKKPDIVPYYKQKEKAEVDFYKKQKAEK